MAALFDHLPEQRRVPPPAPEPVYGAQTDARLHRAVYEHGACEGFLGAAPIAANQYGDALIPRGLIERFRHIYGDCSPIERMNRAYVGLWMQGYEFGRAQRRGGHRRAS